MSSVKWRTSGLLVGLALGTALSGCAGEGAPRMGGVAAEVAGQTIALEDVDVLTDALCLSNVATGDTRYSSPRSSMQNRLVAALVQAGIVEELGLGGDARNTVDTDQVPGWADMTNDEQRELKEFLDSDARLRKALEELSDPSAQSPEEANQQGMAALAERAAEADLDVTINPRYGLAYEDGTITGAPGLSTPVSDEAIASQKVDLTQLSELPESQLCGVRPEAGAAG